MGLRILLVLGWWLALLGIAQAQNARNVVQVAFPSVVLLSLADSKGQPLAIGSGFAVAPGLVATNLHVVAGASSGFGKAIGSAGRYEIEGVAAVDQRNDLAIVRLKGFSAPILRLARSENVVVGDEIYAVGNPQGLEGTLSQGIVSAIRKEKEFHLLQITAAISPGSSGGPVLNRSAQVVGIAVGTYEGGQNLNFAVPAERLETLLRVTETLRPLSAFAKAQKKKDSTSGGARDASGVVGALAECRRTDPSNPFLNADCAFSIRNLTGRTVVGVSGVFIVWDRTGQAMDSTTFAWNQPIRPGLAVRRPGPDIQANDVRHYGRAEVRILDFRYVD